MLEPTARICAHCGRASRSGVPQENSNDQVPLDNQMDTDIQQFKYPSAFGPNSQAVIVPPPATTQATSLQSGNPDAFAKKSGSVNTEDFFKQFERDRSDRVSSCDVGLHISPETQELISNTLKKYPRKRKLPSNVESNKFIIKHFKSDEKEDLHVPTGFEFSHFSDVEREKASVERKDNSASPTSGARADPKYNVCIAAI